MKHRLIEKLITFFFDALAINIAFFLTAIIAMQIKGLYNYDGSLLALWQPSLLVSSVWLFLFFLTGLYRDWFKESRLDEFLVVSRTIILGIGALVLMFFGQGIVNYFIESFKGNAIEGENVNDIIAISVQNKKMIISILIYTTSLLLSATSIRFIIHTIYAWLFRKGFAVKNLVVVGANDSSMKLIKEIQNHPELGYRFVGFIDEEATGEFEGHPILGKYEDIPSLTEAKKVDSLVISHMANSARQILDVLNYCWDENLTIYMAPSLMDVISGHLKTHSVAGVPLIVLLKDHMPSWQAQIKRLFDIVVSLIVLVPFFPIWCIVGLVVKLTDPGPAVYSQERIGQNGKPFIMYKFRSMYTDAEAKSGPAWATENDPRITPWGRFMRKTRLDEVPQMWNVLKGEMSFVGPRPERQHFIDKLTKEIPWYIKRLKMKPGVTGWAQVKHKYDETIEDVKTKVMYDLYYFENMSLLLDIKIILQTVMVVFTGKGAK